MESAEVVSKQVVVGKEFNIYGDFENPLFLAKDVASLIEVSNVSQMLGNVDKDEKGIYNTYTLGGNQNVWFLTEDGLYEVLMLSRKPVAKQFKKEIKKILHGLRTNKVSLTPKYTTLEIEVMDKKNRIESANLLTSLASKYEAKGTAKEVSAFRYNDLAVDAIGRAISQGAV